MKFEPKVNLEKQPSLKSSSHMSENLNMIDEEDTRVISEMDF